MRFSDLYDMEYWNKQCTSKGCTELVPWNEFLSMPSKNIIFVQLCGHRFLAIIQRSAIAIFKAKVNPHDALMSINSTKRNLKGNKVF